MTKYKEYTDFIKTKNIGHTMEKQLFYYLRYYEPPVYNTKEFIFHQIQICRKILTLHTYPNFKI